ncbi:MAG TPA: phosphate propanoyltransferase [Firmicutes bacterium]|nr:phosphate propanoyltransferase [Bacillota bacterium]
MVRPDTEKLIKEIVKKVLENEESVKDSVCDRKRLIPAEISARHVHISENALRILFGDAYFLKKLKALSQPDQFAAEETVRLVGPKRVIENVRVLGPCRSETQVEISKTDAYHLGIPPVIRLSGDLSGTPGILIYGPKGFIHLEQGVIVALRHLHIEDSLAESWGLHNDARIRVRVTGLRPLLLEDIIVRRGPGHKLALHLDTDEGNAADINTGDLLELIQ